MKFFSILSLISTFFLTSFYKKENVKPNNEQNFSDNLTDTLQISLREMEQKSCFSIPFLINDSLFEKLKHDSSFINNKQLGRNILPHENFVHTSISYKYDNRKNTFYYCLSLGNSGYIYKNNSLKMVLSSNNQSDTLIAYINIETLRFRTEEEMYRVAQEPCPNKIDLNSTPFDLKKFNFFCFVDIYNNNRLVYKINH
jgi:hypothetical protein